MQAGEALSKAAKRVKGHEGPVGEGHESLDRESSGSHLRVKPPKQ